MSTTVARPSTGWEFRGLRRHWRLAVAIIAVCTLLGAALALLRAPVYTAETRLAVGSGEMSNLNIPGFPTASAAMAANYAHWIDVSAQENFDLPEGTLTLTASQLPESNVLRLEATSTDSAVAKQAVTKAADLLLAEVNKVDEANDTTELVEKVKQYVPIVLEAQRVMDSATTTYRTSVNEGASEAEQNSNMEAMSAATADYRVKNMELSAMQDRYRRLVSQSSTEANLNQVGSGAAVAGNDRSSFMQRTGLLGFGVGVIAALVGTRLLDRRRSGTAPARSA